MFGSGEGKGVVTRVPAEPFSELVDSVYAQELRRFEFGNGDYGRTDNIATRVAIRFGWSTEKDQSRQIYRYRTRRAETKRGGKWVTERAKSWSLATVEESLFFYGQDMRLYYEEWASLRTGKRASAHEVLEFIDMWENWDLIVAQYDKELESRWCEACEEDTFHDEHGECVWCAGTREARVVQNRRFLDEMRRAKKQRNRKQSRKVAVACASS